MLCPACQLSREVVGRAVRRGMRFTVDVRVGAQNVNHASSLSSHFFPTKL